MSTIPADCKDCVTGVRHEGTPEGTMEKIGGVDCYVATPSGDYPKDKVILFLTDVFGLSLVNNKLLTDGFSQNGYKTIIPDILIGDDLPEVRGEDFDFNAWRAKHGPESWIPVVDKVVAALKESGVARIGTTGYCFGAPPAFYLATKHESHVTVVSHPSRISVEDLEKYKATSQAPLLINSCEIDQAFPKESQEVADKIFGGRQFAPGYERTYWEGCTHGFAVRGDLSDPKVKAGKEGAFEATVKFFKKHL